MEPTLESISDYNKTPKEKKKVIRAVILSGVILGGVYAAAIKIYAHPSDEIKVKTTTKLAMPY